MALSNDTHAALDRCERPQPISDAWLACKDVDVSHCAALTPKESGRCEAQAADLCRRANELPTLADNARKHHACADIIDRVRVESQRVRDLND